MNNTADLQLPTEIKRRVKGLPYTENGIGMSGAIVRMYEDMVLKIQQSAPWTVREVTILKWLHGKVPAPEVIACEEWEGKTYLLMSRIKGKMACDEFFLDRPKELTARLAEAMHILWNVDISDCPILRNPKKEIEEARFRVEQGLVDLDNVEPTTFGFGGFKDPETLLHWLERNQPSYEPVLSHGDFCLPNIFLTETGIGGFIDMGDAGVGDKWRDIALCYRSLRHNMNGKYALRKRKDEADLLFETLNIKPDVEKLRWYLLLDELF